MNNENKGYNKRDRGYLLMRSIMDYGMGLLWCSMGIFLLFVKYFNSDLQYRFDDPSMKIFGGVCLFYGAFRIYRGYKKNYFNER